MLASFDQHTTPLRTGLVRSRLGCGVSVSRGVGRGDGWFLWGPWGPSRSVGTAAQRHRPRPSTAVHSHPTPPPPSRAVLKNSIFCLVKDSPEGKPLGTTHRQPPTANRQSSSPGRRGPAGGTNRTRGPRARAPVHLRQRGGWRGAEWDGRRALRGAPSSPGSFGGTRRRFQCARPCTAGASAGARLDQGALRKI